MASRSIESSPQYDPQLVTPIGLTDYALNHAFRDIPHAPSLRRLIVTSATRGIVGASHLVLKPLDWIGKDLRESPQNQRRLITASVHDAVVRSAQAPEQQQDELAQALGNRAVLEAAYALISATHTPDAAFDLLNIAKEVASKDEGPKDPRRLFFDVLVTAIDKSPVPTPLFNMHFMAPIANRHELAARIGTLTFLSDEYLKSSSASPDVINWIRSALVVDGSDQLTNLAKVLPQKISDLANRIEELSKLEQPIQQRLTELHSKHMNMFNEFSIKKQIHREEDKWNLLRREYDYLLGLYLESRALGGIVAHFTSRS